MADINAVLDSESIDVDNNSTDMDRQAKFVDSMARRIRERAVEMGIAIGTLADAAGIKKSAMTNYWRGDRGYPVDAVPRIANRLSTDVNWLMTGFHRESPEGERDTEETEFVGIQEIDLAYGLGGTFSDGPVEVKVHQFPRGWLEAITSTPPSLLTIARGRGDSMQPTIQDGDMVMIDRSQRTIREQDAIWALTIGDFAMIKRVRAGGERIRILSDNERVPPDEVFHEEINIVGRVIFIGRRI